MDQGEVLLDEIRTLDHFDRHFEVLGQTARRCLDPVGAEIVCRRIDQITGKPDRFGERRDFVPIHRRVEPKRGPDVGEFSVAPEAIGSTQETEARQAAIGCIGICEIPVPGRKLRSERARRQGVVALAQAKDRSGYRSGFRIRNEQNFARLGLETVFPHPPAGCLVDPAGALRPTGSNQPDGPGG